MAFKGKKQPSVHDDTQQSEFIRKFKTNPFIFAGTIVVLVIVIVAFVFVPAIVPEAGGRNVDLTFGSYNKIPISYVPGNYFAQMQELFARNRQQSIDENNYLYELSRIWRNAFEMAAVRTGMLDAVSRSGYAPPVEKVDKETAQRAEFMENGHFSAAKYRQYDSNARLAIWKEVQDTIKERQYRADMSSLLVSSKEADFFASMASPERSFDMAAFPLSQYPDSEIRSFVAANPDIFRVTRLSRITINSEERARQILASIQDGTSTFEEAATTHSQDSYTEKGGDMGMRMVYELATEIPDAEARAAVIALTAGEYSAVIRVPTGWAFFYCHETPYTPDINEGDTLNRIRRYMEAFERGRMEDWVRNLAEEFTALVRESSFDDAIAAKELTKQSFGPLPLNFGGSDLFTNLSSFPIPELGSAGFNENFWRTAFFTPPGEPSKPFVIGNNILVLYPLEEQPAPAEKAAAVQTTVSSYWLSYYTEMNLYSFFLSNPRFENRFDDTFLRVFRPTEGQ